MMRKLLLLLVLCLGLHSAASAQIRDSVKIYLPMFMDTTCPGSQLTFTAVQSNDTFSGVTYRWYANSVFTGVTIDTFKSTALADGDSVYCVIYFTNSFGLPDSFRSNTIFIYRSSSIAPAVLISLIAGSNPDCPGGMLTFQAFPKNGGLGPLYQWMINGAPVAGADSETFSGIFSGLDTITCQMISNSPCSAPYDDTVVSNKIPIIHTFIVPGITISVTDNPICAGQRDTFNAVISTPGTGAFINWYVSGKFIPAAVGGRYITDSLKNGDLVMAIMNTPDACAISDSVNSNVINMTVIPRNNTTVSSKLISGANPGCIDSPLTYTSTFSNFGSTPTLIWLVNGDTAQLGDTIYTGTFKNGDVLTFRVNATDGGCYTFDTLSSLPVLMKRDSTPAAPLLSLIGNMLVNNMKGTYRWYYSPTKSYTGAQIGGITAQTYHAPAATFGTGYYYTILDTSNCPSPPSNLLYISLLKANSVPNAADVKLFPNPTTGMLNMEWSGRSATVSIDVYNVIGQALIHHDVVNEEQHQIDMGNLPDGNYMVVLRDAEDGSVATHKVLLQR